MMRQTTAKNLPRTVTVAGEREEERRIEGDAGATTTATNVKTLPQAIIVAGVETKRRNQREMERWHNPQSREGGSA